jgi:hypothetical protein
VRGAAEHDPRLGRLHLLVVPGEAFPGVGDRTPRARPGRVGLRSEAAIRDEHLEGHAAAFAVLGHDNVQVVRHPFGREDVAPSGHGVAHAEAGVVVLPALEDQQPAARRDGLVRPGELGRQACDHGAGHQRGGAGGQFGCGEQRREAGALLLAFPAAAAVVEADEEAVRGGGAEAAEEGPVGDVAAVASEEFARGAAARDGGWAGAREDLEEEEIERERRCLHVESIQRVRVDGIGMIRGWCFARDVQR